MPDDSTPVCHGRDLTGMIKFNAMALRQNVYQVWIVHVFSQHVTYHITLHNVYNITQCLYIIGLLNTEDSVTRSFSLQQKILLQINSLSDGYYRHLAEYVSSLTWYHNGTKILSNERINFFNNGTSLTISDMRDSDAGKYEVKISSIDYYGYSSFAACDTTVLRMLEPTALHAPVTFYLQQYHIPQYKPEKIIELYFLPMNSLHNSNHTITINYTTDINVNFLFRSNLGFNKRFFRNGVQQYSNTDNVITERSFESEINLSYKLRYSNINEIVGHYAYMETAYYYYYSNTLTYICRGYYYYLRRYFTSTSVLVHYWSLKISKKKHDFISVPKY